MSTGRPSIYTLCDPLTGEVRYVGKANDPQKRLRSHMRDSAKRNTPVCCWIRKLLKRGLQPEMRVNAVCLTSRWQELERDVISQYRAYGARLLNIADGGDEPFCSRDVRAANGKLTAKKIHSDPDRKRLWELKRNMGELLRKGYVKEETKLKMRWLAANYPKEFGRWGSV